MNDAELPINVSDQIDEEAARQILDGLVTYNTSRYGASNRRDLLLTVRSPSTDEVVAGLRGMTHFGWLYVQQLWVSEATRGTGLGTRLIRAAENEARQRDCFAAYVDTFSFQALEFYRKLGYEVFGQIEDFPRGFQRLYLRRYFTESP